MAKNEQKDSSRGRRSPRGKSIADLIFSSLKEQIITCTLEPGTALSESSLANKFRVSKTPVREALHRLKQEGLVKVVPYRGYYISEPSITDARDLYELREIVEVAAAGIAATSATETELAEIEALATMSFESGNRQSEQAFTEANRRFHALIARASHNRRLAWVVEVIHQELQRILYFDLDQGDPESLRQEHMALATALRTRDGALAAKLLREQVQRSKARTMGLGREPKDSKEG